MGKLNKVSRAGCMIFLSLSLVMTNIGGVYAFENKDLSGGAGSIGGGAHRLLNEIALEEFEQKAKADPILKNYNFHPDKKKLEIKGLSSVDDISGEWTKNLFMCEGSDITKIGQTVSDLNSIEEKKLKTFSQWIIDAGFSADEPERYMSWRHFYNPVEGKGKEYLTDLPSDDNLAADYIQSFNSMMGESNPKVNAKLWALSHPDNKFDWTDGTNSLESAFNSQKASESFAAAWRSFGQTLHLICDMTVPAHVRNDSHPARGGYVSDDMRADAYEYIASGNLDIIRSNKNHAVANNALAGKIDKAKKPSELFEAVAGYVNSHFFSSDTIPYKNWLGNLVDNNSDGFVFDLPAYNAANAKDGNSKQFVIQDELGELIMYHESWLDDNGWDEGDEGALDTGLSYIGFSSDIIDKAAVESQARRLIPIAVKSSVKMLDLSIPRVGIDDVSFNKEKLTGKITRYKRQENGSYTPGGGVNSVQRMILFVKLADGGKEENFLLPPVEVKDGFFELDMKELGNHSNFIAGYMETEKAISIEIGLDMGGVLVKSVSALKPELYVEVLSTSQKPGEEIYFAAMVTNGPKNQYFKWDFGDGSKTLEGESAEVSHIYKKAGEYKGTVSLYDKGDIKKILLQKNFKITVKNDDEDTEAVKPNNTVKPTQTPKPEPPEAPKPVPPKQPVEEFDYNAALAAWASDFAAEVNSRKYDNGVCKTTEEFEWVMPPFIKDGQVLGASRIWATNTYYAGEFAGRTIRNTVNEAYDAKNPGAYISLGDLKKKYPQFKIIKP